MSVSAARFVGPDEAQRYTLEAQVPEHTDPTEWLTVLEQLDANGVEVIQTAPLVPVDSSDEPFGAAPLTITVTAARFYGPYHETMEDGLGPELYDFNVQAMENDVAPTEWITVLGAVGLDSVNTIKNAPVAALHT